MKNILAAAALAIVLSALPAAAAPDKDCPIFLCLHGYHHFLEDHPNAPCWADRCVPDDPSKGNNPHYQEACGPVLCGVGDVCCNASCGICTPPGGICIQIPCTFARRPTGHELLIELLLPGPARDCTSGR